MKLNAVYAAIIFLLAVGIFALGQRVADGDAALRAATDSADVRTARLSAEVFAAEARERVLFDSALRYRQERAIYRARAGAERLKADSLLAFALHMDSIAIPRPVVIHIIQSFEVIIMLKNAEIAQALEEVNAYARMYASADSGRAALFDALQTQRSLTHAWKIAARPPLFSLRRFKPAIACGAGFKGLDCVAGFAYAF